MNKFIFTDWHIKEKDLQECQLIADELLCLIKEFSINEVCNIGDSFHVIKPSNLELDFFANFLQSLPVPMKMIVASSHESVSENNHILNHFSILHNKIELYPTDWTDGNLLLGHYICAEALKGFHSSITKKGLMDRSKLALLGHQHTFEELEPNRVYQLGSCRSVNFDESGEKKKIAIIINYGTKNQKLEFIPLSSPYPMKTLTFVAGVTFPDWKKENPLTKTRYIFKDLDSYKNFIPFEQKVKNYFTMFKVEFDLTKKDYIANEEKKESITLEQSFKDFCVKNKVDNRIANIINRAITTSGENNEVKS